MADRMPDTEQGRPYLGVSHSVSGRRWALRTYDDRTALAMGQAHGLPDVVARVLAARDVGIGDVSRFLNPRLSDSLPDPGHLRDMAPAVGRLARAVVGRETVGIFGDYDVDGATATALLTRYFRALGMTVHHHVPDRLLEGYGPNPEALIRLARAGSGLVVTVDCGATAHEALEAARAEGVEVVVVDHHAGIERLPPALAVVNPNRLDETTPHRQLAAVGVAFMVAVALNRRLRENGWFARNPEPNLLQWLDLVALGTVCDVVSLTGVNRALVVQGLKILAGRSNPGIKALADVAGVRERPTAYHLGFVLGPRINAGGRVGEADLGVRLLTTENPDEAVRIAKRLDDLNRDRQAIETDVLNASLMGIESTDGADGAPIILSSGRDWHPGVIGIVASRLKERFNRPACVISFDGEEGVGSGRSIPGVDLGAMILAARQAGLLIRGGGHAMAAGFALEERNLEDFRRFLIERVAARIAEDDLKPVLKLDGALSIGGISESLVSTLEQVGPFGSGNAEPRFALSGVRVGWAGVVGEKHVKCVLVDAAGGRVDGIAFRALDTDLGSLLLKSGGVPIHVAGRARINTWRDSRTPQFQIDDAATAMGTASPD